MKSVRNTFSPELINRIDDTIVFHSLSEKDVFQIIDLQLNDLSENLAKMGLKIKLSIGAKRLLAKNGYDVTLYEKNSDIITQASNINQLVIWIQESEILINC